MRLNFGGYKWIPVDGYGRLSLKTAQALIRLGHEVYPFEVETLDKPAWFMRAQGLRFDRVTVQLCPPHDMRHVPGRSVGYSMHESETLPESWPEHLNRKCQYVLTPSQWIKQVFADNGVKVPMEVIPAAIDPEECSLVTPNQHGPFVFGCLADRGTRKGWDLAYMAFYKVFGPRNRDVRLIVKCRPGSIRNLDFSYSPDDRLIIWQADVANIADIYAQIDAYIFPTRAEGLGLPPREAAACGLPVVCTRYSGVADDLDEWAIPLERYTMVDSHMQGCGGLWANPDLDEVCEKMLWLYEHQDEARAKGAQAAQWLRANRTYEHSARRIVQVLNRWLGGPVEDIPANVKSNGHLKERIGEHG